VCLLVFRTHIKLSLKDDIAVLAALYALCCAIVVVVAVVVGSRNRQRKH
jgi:hypothetical protein